MTTYTVSFCGTGCSRDEGEVTRKWERRDWQFWMSEERLKSHKNIYAPNTGYIPVRLQKEISGDLKALKPSATVRGVGENDWFNQAHTSEALCLDGPLKPSEDLKGYVESYGKDNQRSVPAQMTGWAAAALALHGANLAAGSGAKTINFIGHSRGAVESIMAAWFIYAYGTEEMKKIPINIFAIDPVPGPGEWYGILTQLPPNVASYVGLYSWDHLDTGFSALVPKPNGQMTGKLSKGKLGGKGKLGKTWKTLADDCQMDDPLAASSQVQPQNYELYACRGKHGTVAGNITIDGLYDPDNTHPDVTPVPELAYKMARGYLTKWGTVFNSPCAVEDSVTDLRRKIHTDHAKFDAMGCGETRTSRLPARPYVRQVSSISGRNTWNTYYMDDVAGDPPYKLAFPVTFERNGQGWVDWKFL